MAFDKTTLIQNAQKFTIKGQIDKAIEEWQKIIKETPNDGNTYNIIGDLYLKKNNNQEAVSSYLKAAKAFDQAGFSLKTIAVYKKIIKIDPENFDIYVKLADLDAERGLIANAIEEYLKVIKHYSKSGFHKDSISIYKKIVNLDSNNIPMRLKLVELCVKEGEKKDAIEQFIQIAAIYKSENKILDGEEALRRALALEPGHTEATQLLKEFQSSDASSPSPVPDVQYENLQTENIPGTISFQEFSLTDEPSVVKKEGVKVEEEKVEKAGPDIQKLLEEAEAYLKNRLFDQAVEIIKSILETDPGEREAQKLLLEIHQLKAETAKDVPVSSPAEAPIDSFFSSSPEIQAGSGLDLSAFESAISPLPDNQMETTGTPALPGLDDEKVKEKLAEGEFYVQQGLLGEAKIIYETILKYFPENGLAKMKLNQILNSLNETGSQSDSGLGEVFTEVSSKPILEESPESVLNEISEVISSEPVKSSNGSFNPGTVKLKTTVLDKTEDTDFVNLMGELEEEFKEEPVQPSDEEIQDDDFGKIIKEFQKGIQANIGEKDFETHFDLGIAYKEMGLRTEAIGEFQIAIKGGSRAVDSAIVLSQCYLEEGLPKLAIEQLSTAIQMKQLNSDQIHSLKYELANLYDLQENFEEALNVLSDIYKENVSYRDVSKKISQLRQKISRKA